MHQIMRHVASQQHHSRRAGYSHIAVQDRTVLGQVEHKVIDGDHHLIHLGVDHLAPLNVHRELLVGLVAV